MMLDLIAVGNDEVAARAELNNLCKTASGGKVEWRMSIPARNTDSDILLADALDRIPALVARVRELECDWLVQRERHGEEVRRILATNERLMERVRELEALLGDVIGCVDDIDPRMRWVNLQVDRETLESARAAVGGVAGGTQP